VGKEVRSRVRSPSQAQDAQPNDVWHLDEVVISITGKKRWMWRAVDQDGYVLDEIVQSRRDTKAAKRLLTRLMRKQGMAPKWIITDKLPSYGTVRRQVMPSVEHGSHKDLNNRAENSHVPLRKQERMMQGFRSAGGLQRFASVFSAARNLFVPPRPYQSALAAHLYRLQAMAAWKAAAGVLA
jgi:putative transposase